MKPVEKRLGVTVLIVDDEPGVRKLAADILRLRGFVAVEASGGQDALVCCARHPPDVVLTDVVMPGMNGAELLQEIARLYPGVPVLLMSGSDTFAMDLVRSVPAGRRAKIIPKPCTRSVKPVLPSSQAGCSRWSWANG